MLRFPMLSSMSYGGETLSSPFDYDPGTEVIGADLLIRTENAVFTDDGRYFVAGEHSDPKRGWGIYEVKKSESGYGLEQIIHGLLEVDSSKPSYPCLFTGLTTNGRHLFATAAVHLEGNIRKTDFGALFRILPGEGQPEVAIAHYQPSDVHAFNGMAVGPDGSLYMSDEFAFPNGSNVAIYKVSIIDPDDFTIRITPWLAASLLRDILPNGIQIKDQTMYYVSGKGLFSIDISRPEPGVPIPIYLSMIPNNLLDDLAILPDGRVAVGEIDALMNMIGFHGWGINQIVTVDPSAVLLNRQVTLTSPYTVSSLAFAQRDLFTDDKLITTSWFHGGLREIGLP